MPTPEVHLMQVELIADRRTVRYSCAACGRVMEDGPDALVVLSRGDPQARHHGGTLREVQADVEADDSPPPALH